MDRTQETKRSLYLNQVCGAEDSFLKKISSTAKKAQAFSMQISPHEGKILHLLARLVRAQKIVEIGSLYGYSTCYLARALGARGVVYSCDLEKQHEATKQLFKNQPEYKKIKWITGKALDTLPLLEKKGPFDLVFIDADKANYGHYLQWAERNLKKGGLLIADNTFLFGSVYGEDSRSASQKTVKMMKLFNKTLCQSPQWTGLLIPTVEGLTVALKN